MLVKGDVKCLHCGFISGQWVGMKGASLTLAGYTPGQLAQSPASLDSPVRCARCDGPVYLEDVEPILSGHRLRRIRRLRAQIAAFDSRRRGAA